MYQNYYNSSGHSSPDHATPLPGQPGPLDRAVESDKVQRFELPESLVSHVYEISEINHDF